jgi:hypothetical protein
MAPPHTPPQSRSKKVPNSATRTEYFWHFDHRRDDETMASVAQAHGITECTARRWRKERELLGASPSKKRTRRFKAQKKGQKLGRPYRVPQDILEELIKDDNPVDEEPLAIQADYHNIPLSERSMRRNLSERVDARMYIAAYSHQLRDANKALRVTYGHENEDKELIGYWDRVFFTDEAHYNPSERFQKPRKLRKAGNLNRMERLVAIKQRNKSPQTVHMYAYCNWHFRSPLHFYNDEKDMLPKPKPPQKPRKSKYESQEQHDERIKQWEANKPPPVEQDSKGAHMTQAYYTKKLLPEYIKAVH